MNGTTITGYLSNGATFCPACIHDLFLPYELVAWPGLSTEHVLDFLARKRELDRHDLDSYSSYDFPQPLHVSDTSEADACVQCGRLLL